MRILLTLPYDTAYDWSFPDLGLGYISSALKKKGHEVTLCLKPGDFPSPEKFQEFIAQGRFDAVGIKVIFSTIETTRNTIRLIRQICNHIPVILGGPQVSADPRTIFALIPEVDYAFHGEAEEGASLFFERYRDRDAGLEAAEEIPNLIWKHGSEVKINSARINQNLDTIAFPAWELMPPKSFPCAPFNNVSKRYPIAPMLLTRGCPSQCTFCGAGLVQGHTVRSRSVANILEELTMLTTQYDVKEIHFFDSNCSHRAGPLRELCKRIIAEKIHISWCAPNGIRIDSIDDELAFIMKKSGCFQVSVGIESGSQRILKNIKKGISLPMINDRVHILRKAGLEVTGFFVLGFPDETVKEIEDTISLAVRLPLTNASFSILTPLPGTELYNDVYQKQKITIDELRSFSFMQYKNSLSELDSSTLIQTQKKAYWRFYARPHIFVNFLKNLNNLHKIKFLLVRIYRVISKKR